MKYYCAISTYHNPIGGVAWEVCNIVTTNEKLADAILRQQQELDYLLTNHSNITYRLDEVEVEDYLNIESEILEANKNLVPPLDDIIEPKVYIQLLLDKGILKWCVHLTLLDDNKIPVVYSSKVEPNEYDYYINKINNVLDDYKNLNLPIETYREILAEHGII